MFEALPGLELIKIHNRLGDSRILDAFTDGGAYRGAAVVKMSVCLILQRNVVLLLFAVDTYVYNNRFRQVNAKIQQRIETCAHGRTADKIRLSKTRL